MTIILKRVLIVTLEHFVSRTENTLDDKIIKIVKEALE